MPRTLAALLLLSVTTGALAQKPHLHELVTRLLEADDKVVWQIERLSDSLGGRDQNAEDCELALKLPGEPVSIAFGGPRSAVVAATAVIQPIDPDTREGRQSLAKGVDALAAATGIDAKLLRAWVIDNREAIRGGDGPAAGDIGGLRFVAHGFNDKQGLTVYLNAYFDEEENDKPAKGLPAFEATVRDGHNWSAESTRTYQHDSGVLMTFGEDHLGPYARCRYNGRDQKQANMTAAVWLLVMNLGETEAAIGANNDLVQDWFANPTPQLALRGADVTIDVDPDRVTVITVRPTD